MVKVLPTAITNTVYTVHCAQVSTKTTSSLEYNTSRIKFLAFYVENNFILLKDD
jgi:hypothetical protein